jgi:hypothetical protein
MAAPANSNDAPVPDSSAVSVVELEKRARAALPSYDRFFAVLSPALPASWPPSDARIEWFAYRHEPLPTGMIAYRTIGPLYRVSIALPEGQPKVETVAHGVDLGRDDNARDRSAELAPAEGVLVEVLMKRRTPESARAALDPYLVWASGSSALANDVRRRKAGFFRRLAATKPE